MFWVPSPPRGCAAHPRVNRAPENPRLLPQGTLTRFTSGPPEFPYCREEMHISRALHLPSRTASEAFSLETNIHPAQKHVIEFPPPTGLNGEGNGNPLHYSCLENSMDRGAWTATVHGVAKSQTRPKRLSTTSLIGLSAHSTDKKAEARSGQVHGRL